MEKIKKIIKKVDVTDVILTLAMLLYVVFLCVNVFKFI